MAKGAGHAVASYYRQETAEGRGPWQGTTNTCVECERPTIEHLEDMRCAQCNGTLPDDTEERRKARVDLYTRTAEKCRRWGDLDGAKWFEDRIAPTTEAEVFKGFTDADAKKEEKVLSDLDAKAHTQRGEG